MATPVAQYDYHLPPERIAQSSVEPRDASRLLVLGRQSGAIEHKVFRDIVGELQGGDVLVMNNTKVFKARLHAIRFEKEFEVFLLRPVEGALPDASLWHALVRPGKRLHEGNTIGVYGKSVRVAEKRADGSVVLAFPMSESEVIEFANANGEIPVPPYVGQTPTEFSRYQTVYAKETGSVAAPTAGFHFTPELLEQLKEKGVQIEFVTLHVGIGTFRPMKSETLEEHEMHSEFVTISPETAQAINAAKAEGRRVIAVGTTTTRALEGVAQQGGNPLPDSGFTGDVNLFITPGFSFKVIDGLITNFHLPKSTLLVLVSAFAGREPVLEAYKQAVEKEYRFYSFGDAMFIR